jgi:hypothetical protein
MSLYDYIMSLEIGKHDFPFYTLVMAAMRQADTDNLELLKKAFPETWAELAERYNAPGGRLPGEENYSVTKDQEETS